MKKIFTTFSVILLCYTLSYAQGLAISDNNADPDASAILDVKSTVKGLLLPRMTEVQRKAIVAPAVGLIVYQTNNSKGFYVFDGSWKPLGDQLGDHTATDNIRLGTFRLSHVDTSVGIGIDAFGKVIVKGRRSGVNADPQENFVIHETGSFVAYGDTTTGVMAATGKGVRMMWHPSKAAFRAGELTNFGLNNWDENVTGKWSTAFGTDVMASGKASIAVGSGSRASGFASFAAGANNRATGQGSVAFGIVCESNSDGSVAMGGFNRAEGQYSVALGSNSIATGDYSTAMGYLSIAQHHSSMVISDASTHTPLVSTSNYQYSARFVGGFRLLTNNTLNQGVMLRTNAWEVISDSTRKEKFAAADGEMMLTKLRRMRMGSWNYKGIAQHRHYGPMAQEFFTAFGKDQYGTIGCDTTINQADMEGVLMILIHALEARTNQQCHEMGLLKEQNKALMLALSEANKQNEQQQLIQVAQTTEAVAQKEKWNLLMELLAQQENTKHIPAKIAALAKPATGAVAGK